MKARASAKMKAQHKAQHKAQAQHQAPPRLDCQGAKCIMRENLCRVYEWRKTGLLCDLGPAVFQTPTDFLTDVLTQTPRSHLIPPSSDLVVFADVHGDFLAL